MKKMKGVVPMESPYASTKIIGQGFGIRAYCRTTKSCPSFCDCNQFDFFYELYEPLAEARCSQRRPPAPPYFHLHPDSRF
ncbi:hypothetical protein QN277_025343 [Acacia crassicarpa]|uniref:Uncharacterized protein n=1 Tax=Acacia crassicarpa TaxID=499986 RepID=A0AAE1JE41_9FABA|nr:hypothetical protein QN277_025343 [Acacia crassicarpa]